MSLPRMPRENCLNCYKVTSRVKYKYCSNSCQLIYQHKKYITQWKNGEVQGLQSIGVVSCHIKKYLREKFENKCCLCGWSKINPRTLQVPLVADHIDGNWRNNLESNLRLICPNCDSLTSTYAGLNRGKGRKGRSVSKRVLESRLFIKNMNNTPK